MADINNFTEITENFDTIKTLLNSIRAQGILNTSDVDKLLAGINSKLEKINTDEDVELIKIFLSELKQNLDERHNTLLSKFGAIESLFSSLLKNSSETLKTNEVKELFDIVATNLSVFSREVVSQKETLSDITLRLDAMRSDDTQKKEIVKNISFLKNDIERLTNGFDSIVLSLNENFKTVVKNISSIESSDNSEKFGKELEDIVNSSNTILSALQMLDKKSLQIEDTLRGLATQDDIQAAKKWLSDLAAQEQNLIQSVDGLAEKYYKIDNLADKIDASVDILAGLKTIFSEKDEQGTSAILHKLIDLEQTLSGVSTAEAFEDFRLALEASLKSLYEGSVNLQSSLTESSVEMQKINDAIKALDLNVSFKSLAADLGKSEQNIREHVSIESGKVIELVDVNTTRTLNEISANADSLSGKLAHAQSLISALCEKSFEEVEENIAGLKAVVAQIDENNVSANNAIFSNITDRLAMFETNLKISLENQENYVSNSSKELIEQISNIKELSSVLDYKMDASSMEISNSKVEFSALKNAVEDVLALDFVNKVKDLKVDLYAAKQELADAVESSSSDLSDKFSNDLFGKYELLISKLDSIESELKLAQSGALNGIKSVLDNISSSIVDVLSYVSSGQDINTDSLEIKLDGITKAVSDNNLNFIENVRDVIEVIRAQVDNNIKSIQEDIEKQLGTVNSSIQNSNIQIRDDIKESYSKLLETQNNFDINLNNLKNSILDKISEFEQEFTCDNAEKVSEMKFAAESLHAKGIQNAIDLKDEIKGEILKLAGSLKLNLEELSEQFAGTSLRVEGVSSEVINYVKNDLTPVLNNSVGELETQVTDISDSLTGRVDDIVSKFGDLENSVKSLTTTTTASLTSTLAKVLENFVSLKALLNSLNDKTAQDIAKNVELITSDFAKLSEKFDVMDVNIDEDLTRQLSIIESNFEMLNQNLVNLFAQNDNLMAEKLNIGLTNMAGILRETVVQNLAQYKGQVEALFNNLSEKNAQQAVAFTERADELSKILQTTLDEQNIASVNALKLVAEDLKLAMSENLQNTSADYSVLKAKVEGFVVSIEECNKTLAENLKTQLDDIAKFVDSGLDIQAQEVNNKFGEISLNLKNLSDIEQKINEDLLNKIKSFSVEIGSLKNEFTSSMENNALVIVNKLEGLLGDISLKNDNLVASVIQLTADMKNAVEEKIDDNSVDINAKLNALIEQLQIISKEASERTLEIKKVLSGNVNDEIKELYSKITNLFEEHSLNLVSQFSNNDSKFIDDLNAKTIDLKASFELLNSRLDKDEVSRMNVFQSQLNELGETFNVLINEAKSVTKSEVSAISETLIKNSKEAMEEVEKSIEDKVNAILVTSADVAAGELQSMELFTNKILEQIEGSKQTVLNFVNDFVKKEIDIITANIEKETDVIVGDLIEQMSILRDANKDELANLTTHIESTVEDYLYNNINDLKSYLDLKSDNSSLVVKLDNLTTELNASTEDVLSALTLFDKKFTDKVLDKYEDVDLALQNLLSEFASSKSGVDELASSFEDLKAQILSRTLEESVTSQVQGIEDLVKEQLGYLEDISDLCCANLPELTEMNAIVKHGLLESVNAISEKLDSQGVSVSEELAALKTDVITQFLNIFNQISFVAEQEEILDFIQEKHSELITILSHIVTTIDDVETVKDNLSVVDNKVDALKEDIDLINEKITSIISSDGDIDYVYSLQDLESDIANLRISLNEVKESNKSKELEDLIASTNDIYKLVDSIKSELPRFDSEEFKKDFDALNEDIVSISTRTNKLILASDESYKTLQENLQDFKLVINDLDERTRNFAQEAGLDRIDNKLGAINTMINNGAKTNQVFNQVFEYLAEWVDNAGAQISAISDKVETLDEIGQIKVMLEDLRAEAEDNSESDELIEALGAVFDKQAKKIASLEAKLDRVIVETTINNKNNKIDMTPLEETLNRFLVAIDDRMSAQQAKINSLEAKLEDVISMFNPKDTAQLTKKVGGMDRQIAKLNKSIEKIASHVVEK